MSDLKSKLPDMNEITSMASKLFKDVKKSITEIISDYKNNHPAAATATDDTAEKKATKAKKSESETVETETTEDDSKTHAKKDDE